MTGPARPEWLLAHGMMANDSNYSVLKEPDRLPAQLAARLRQPLPGPAARRRFEPALSYGRHEGPAPHDARPAAVMILLYPLGGRWHLPLTVRPATMVWHAGQISLPGGAVEPGETSSQAALREVHEELAVLAEQIELLGPLSTLYLFASNFVVTPWVGVSRERPDFLANPAEVAEVLEVPLADIIDPAHAGAHTRQVAGVRFRAPHLQWGRHRIWGATGMILGELIALVDEMES